MKKILLSICVLVGFCVVGYYGYFLRQPNRAIPQDETLFISPANGKIIHIQPWDSSELIITKGKTGAIQTWTDAVDTKGTLVSIQMTPLNVHYQRMPVTAKLIDKTHVMGLYKNAMAGTIRHENEHNILLFETPNGERFSVIQIAGFMARRIEDYVKIGNTYKQGDVIGLIKLGSQVSVVLPQNIVPVVTIRDTVIDGETILGTYSN